MIETVDEFVHLVNSEEAVERRRAAWEEASLEVWRGVIEQRPDMRFWVAHNRTVPAEVLRVLIDDSDWRVRDRIANRNSCPGDILALLADDEHEAVASTVAGHLNTPDSALRKLTSHAWSQVREKAIDQLERRGVAVADTAPGDGAD